MDLLAIRRVLRRGRALWLLAFSLVCALGGGCSRKTYWYHPDRTLAQAETDCRECYYQAQVEAAEAAGDQRLDRAELQAEATLEQWSYAYQDSRFRRCMKRRGYQLTSERELKPPVRKRVARMGTIDSVLLAGD